MSQSHDSITQVGSSITTTINNGSISSNSTLAISSDGYMSAFSDGAISVVSDGGDLTLAANNPGTNIVLGASSTGEISARAPLRQYGTAGTITLNNLSIAGSGAMTMTASNGIATVSGLTGCSVTAGTGDVTLSGTNIYISGELDTASGGLTVKANNGSSDVTITSPIATGRAGQPGITVTGGSSSANGITVTGGSTDGYGIVSTGSGTGPGILARGGASGGYGLIAEAIDGVRSSLRLVPQSGNPSTNEIGDVYIRNQSGLMSVKTSDPTWGNVVTKVRSITSAITTTIASDSSDFVAIHSIPANTLRAGSTVRCTIVGTATDPVGLPSLYGTFDGDFAPVSSAQLTNATNRFTVDLVVSIESTTTYSMMVAYDTLSLSTYARRFSTNAGTSFTNTHAVNVGLWAACGEGGCVIRVDQFIVDITD